LEKKGWTTPDALAAVRRRWKLDARRLSYGGLKDRHAETVQYLTVFRGPQRKLTPHDGRPTHPGPGPRAHTSHDTRGNRFTLVLRSLDRAEADRARSALEEVRAEGVPNYFDDQRFGSAGAGGEFVARLMVLERYEEALRLALTGPYEHDRRAQKKE